MTSDRGESIDNIPGFLTEVNVFLYMAKSSTCPMKLKGVVAKLVKCELPNDSISLFPSFIL